MIFKFIYTGKECLNFIRGYSIRQSAGHWGIDVLQQKPDVVHTFAHVVPFDFICNPVEILCDTSGNWCTFKIYFINIFGCRGPRSKQKITPLANLIMNLKLLSQLIYPLNFLCFEQKYKKYQL